MRRSLPAASSRIALIKATRVYGVENFSARHVEHPLRAGSANRLRITIRTDEH